MRHEGPVSRAQRRASELTDTPLQAVVGREQCPIVTRVRVAAIAVARDTSTLSLRQLAERFDNRDHKAIVNALKRAERLKATDPAFAALVQEIAA